MPHNRWLAYELHDGLLQWVLGARMQIAALLSTDDDEQRGFEHLSRAELTRRLTLVMSFLNEAADEGRQLIHFIDEHPDRQIDLAIAIAAFANLVSGRGGDGTPVVELTMPDPSWPQVEPRRAWAFLRIVQQAITNSVRHSGAAKVTVTLRSIDDRTIQAIVRDEGCGFDPSADFGNQVGLKSMRQRAKGSKLQLEILSEPGRGCEVQLTCAI